MEMEEEMMMAEQFCEQLLQARVVLAAVLQIQTQTVHRITVLHLTVQAIIRMIETRTTTQSETMMETEIPIPGGDNA